MMWNAITSLALIAGYIAALVAGVVLVGWTARRLTGSDEGAAIVLVVIVSIVAAMLGHQW